MKTKFLFAALLITTSLSAQNTPSYFSFNLGFSLPYGDLASKNLENEDAGFSKAGADINIEGVYYFMDFLGIGGKFGNNVLFFDKFAYRQQYTEERGAEDVQFIRASPYRNIYGFAGMHFNLPLTNQFHISLKALGGIVLGFSSAKEINVIYPNGNEIEIIERQAANFAFSPLFGMDMRYYVKEDFMIKLSAETIAYTQNYGYDISGDFLGKSQPYRLISLTMGVAAAF